jgi:hypothetical protein
MAQQPTGLSKIDSIHEASTMYQSKSSNSRCTGIQSYTGLSQINQQLKRVHEYASAKYIPTSEEPQAGFQYAS